jgi:hypothetical protein
MQVGFQDVVSAPSCARRPNGLVAKPHEVAHVLSTVRVSRAIATTMPTRTPGLRHAA